ncbi:MAG TPA: protein translocase subunit SecF [Propionicimonas sp.]|nr:protein translocase subunit SecF [Propionicimonas sp.]
MSTEVIETPQKPKKSGLAHKLYTGEVSYDFVAKRKRWYLISAVLLLVSLGALLIKGPTWGIEFTGGADFQAPIKVTANTVDDVRAAVAELNLPNADDISVTTVGDSSVRVQTKALTTEQVTQVKGAIAAVAGTQPDEVGYSLIGASWGQQITTQALIALAVFLALVMLLIWAYFRDFKMSIAAIAALLHDLIVTVGVYALVGFTVTPATMIGVLTILGYSLYDTVVVFDRIRENTRDITNTKHTYSVLANQSLNQVLVRSLNTTIIGVLPVAALLFTGWFVLGTGPLKDLGLALFIGMIAGAYSSIFIATPLLAQMREADSDMKEHRERLARRAARTSERATHKPTAKPVSTVAVGDPEVAAVDPATLGLVSAKDLASGERRQPTRQPRSQRKK